MITSKLIETTGTVDGFTYQPHTYYLNKDSKLVAFDNGVEYKVFSKPLAFDQRGRTFKKSKVSK